MPKRNLIFKLIKVQSPSDYLKNCLKFLLVFTFLVSDNYGNTLFPESSKSQPLQGYLPTSEFQLHLRTLKDVKVVDDNNQIQLLPQNTILETTSSFETILNSFNAPMRQDEDDIYFSELISNISLMRYFELQEMKGSESQTSERKSTKQKVKIIDSMDKKLMEKRELVIHIDKKVVSSFEVIAEDRGSMVLESDFKGDKNWDPEVYEEVTDPKTEAKSIQICKKCETSTQEQINKQAGKILLETTAQKVNHLFNKLESEYDTKIKRQLEKSIDFALATRSPESTGWCYRYVKNALMSSGITVPRLNGNYAKNAGLELEKQGFTNLLDSKQLSKTRLKAEKLNEILLNPNLAPKGAILVYEPNPKDRKVRDCEKKNKAGHKICIWDQDAGHIEIKTAESGKGGFVSDYYNDRARTGQSAVTVDRKLIGVYYKL